MSKEIDTSGIKTTPTTDFGVTDKTTTPKSYYDPTAWAKFLEAVKTKTVTPTTDTETTTDLTTSEDTTTATAEDTTTATAEDTATSEDTTAATAEDTDFNWADWWNTWKSSSEEAMGGEVTEETSTPDLTDANTRTAFVQRISNELKDWATGELANASDSETSKKIQDNYAQMLQSLEEWSFSWDAGVWQPLPTNIIVNLPDSTRQAIYDYYDQSKLASYFETSGQNVISDALVDAINKYKESLDQSTLLLPVFVEGDDTQVDASLITPESTYGVAYFDDQGNQYTKQQLQEMELTNPNMPITAVYDIGGGSVVQATPASIMDIMGLSAQDVINLSESELPENKAKEQLKQQLKQQLDEDKAALLQGVDASNYREKAALLYNLYLKGMENGAYTLPAHTQDPYVAALNDVEAAMTEEQQKVASEIAEGEQYAAEHAEEREQAAEDAAKLAESTDTWNEKYGTSLADSEYKDEETRYRVTLQKILPSGISLLDSYPYVTPLSEAQLATMSAETLEILASYLNVKGISWSDFQTIGENYFGGGGNYSEGVRPARQ